MKSLSPGCLRILVSLRKHGPSRAEAFVERDLDRLYRAKLVRLVPGHNDPVVELTDAGKAAVPAEKPKMECAPAKKAAPTFVPPKVAEKAHPRPAWMSNTALLPKYPPGRGPKEIA